MPLSMVRVDNTETNVEKIRFLSTAIISLNHNIKYLVTAFCTWIKQKKRKMGNKKGFFVTGHLTGQSKWRLVYVPINNKSRLILCATFGRTSMIPAGR